MSPLSMRIWEPILIGVFLGFVALGASGGILFGMCYLAPEPSKCMADLSLPLNAAAGLTGIIVFILAAWWIWRE